VDYSDFLKDFIGNTLDDPQEQIHSDAEIDSDTENDANTNVEMSSDKVEDIQ